ncbi:hypothetical protein SRDD_04810 [Serratia sp. DD3]|nr:hypothetical protein SRDD_04810 [Serratia sp. DD3]
MKKMKTLLVIKTLLVSKWIFFVMTTAFTSIGAYGQPHRFAFGLT